MFISVYLNRIKDPPGYLFSIKCSEKAGHMACMAGCPFLDDFVEEAVLIAVYEDPRDPLYMSALFPLFPYLIPAPAIKMGKPCAGRESDRFLVGIRDHQHLVGNLVLDNDGDKSVLVT